MKRILIFALAIAVLLSACSFNVDRESVIDVITLKSDYDINYYYDFDDPARNDGIDQQGGETAYYAVSKRSDINGISAFAGDDITIYTAVSDDYESYIDPERSEVLNRLKKKELFDLNGNSVELTPILSDIMEQIADLEHDMLLVQIFEDGGAYFVYVELNVNWWSPCRLYYYHQDSKQLKEICTFDRERIIGLRIRDHEFFNIQKTNPPSIENSEGDYMAESFILLC